MPTRAGAADEAAAGDSSASTGFFAISPLKWRTPLVMTSRGLVDMREQENLGVAEDLARKMQGRRRTAEKAARHADDGVAGAVREQLIAANEQVETRHGFVHPLHDARAEAICLYEIDGWSEVRAADLDRPGAREHPTGARMLSCSWG